MLAEGQVSGDKTQEQVDQLTSNLQSAMKVLVKKADITLERAEAEKELASVHKLDESVYTTDSWQAMQEALEIQQLGKKVLNSYKNCLLGQMKNY